MRVIWQADGSFDYEYLTIIYPQMKKRLIFS